MNTTITTEQIEALRTEAGAAGDSKQVELCTRALDGDADARRECATVIALAAATNRVDSYVATARDAEVIKSSESPLLALVESSHATVPWAGSGPSQKYERRCTLVDADGVLLSPATEADFDAYLAAKIERAI